ncbi:MAG: hypothetical protein NVSMB27_24800 [Ktedonobacteraceae bacterium]
MRFFVAAALLVSLLLSSLAASPVASASATSTTGHGCAWPTPPGIPGSPPPAPAVPGIVVINEVLLVPNSTWNCAETPGTYFITTDSWIEIYNTQNQPYDLYAAHTEIDSGPNTNAFILPFGAAIAAHGYLVVFPRTNAKIVSTETTTQRLNIPNLVIYHVTVPTLGPDQSFARTSDGASSWQVTSTPTIDASNTSLQVTPTPTSPPDGHSGGSGNGRGYVGTPTGHKTLVNGNQPQWNKLQLPSATPTSSSVTLLPTTVTPSSPASNTQFELVRRIALTVLLIALAVTLFWCWRKFS